MPSAVRHGPVSRGIGQKMHTVIEKGILLCVLMLDEQLVASWPCRERPFLRFCANWRQPVRDALLRSKVS